jgi:signal transduction histidine kinase
LRRPCQTGRIVAQCGREGSLDDKQRLGPAGILSYNWSASEMARILHIEDDPANRLLVRKLLQMAGHVVTDAADGLEGVHLARAEPPDLVLVDLNLPGLDGYEVTLRLRGEPSLAGVPIVAITAEGDRDTSLAVGCDGFLQKPIDAREFAATVEGYLGGRREATSPDLTGSRLRAQSYRIVAHLEEKVAELSAANEQLLELDRGRKEFYRNISHELATPMTPIVGYIKLLVDEELGATNTAQVKALRAMEDCARRLRGLIDNLLDVSALETGNMRFMHRDYDFLDTTRRAVARVADRLAERRITLFEDLPRGPLPGWGDSERLSRAIGQLLDNAAKFTPSGGFVGVRVRRQPNGVYELCVADTGPGISPDRAGRLFEPFYQVDGSPTRLHGGVGVGLAIARRIARGLGGDVRFLSPANESMEGSTLNGTAFYLTVLDRAPEVVAPGRG